MTGPAPIDDREPRECTACGTVSPWTNERCRACDAVLPDPTPPAEEVAPIAAGRNDAGPGAKPGPGGLGRRRIGIRWIIGGAGLFLLVYATLQLGLMGVILADDNPDLAPIKQEIDRTFGRERAGQHTPLDQLDVEHKGRVRDALVGNSLFVVGVFAMLLLPPFFGGLLVGRFSNSLFEAAAACGAGAFFGGAFIEGDIWIGLVLLAVMAPLGLPGAALGRYWHSRRRPRGSA
ncbi:MAG TPA: hypothetical protein VM285_12335 [Polyangia bacterium]|nr:hypothetical protein [Polyangia bacterium]